MYQKIYTNKIHVHTIQVVFLLQIQFLKIEKN